MKTETKTLELLDGTINYISPEFLNSGLIHKKNDLWACGVMIYILFTGINHFEGKDDEETMKR
jgi:serine/threonine protein kinase